MSRFLSSLSTVTDIGVVVTIFDRGQRKGRRWRAAATRGSDLERIRSVFVLYKHDSGSMPRQRWRDIRSQGAFTPSDINNTAQTQFGFDPDGAIFLPVNVLGAILAERRAALQSIVEQYIQMIKRSVGRSPTIPGFEFMQSVLDSFYDDHPSFDQNVFIAMRFGDTPQSDEIHSAVKKALLPYGLHGLRADDRVYPPDHDLWTNVCVYMMGCKYGICVFEDFATRTFNPNVPLEYGFMRAMNRHVLLLKEKQMPVMPADITGKLYRSFDVFNIEASIAASISTWAERELGLSKRG